MNWERVGDVQLEERDLPGSAPDHPAQNRDGGAGLLAVIAEARDQDSDNFEDFDEEDFDDEFDDDFEEEQDEEYEAENEEYPDDDFGTGGDEEIDGIEIEGDIEGDFDEVATEAEPAEIEEDEGDVGTADAD